MSIETQLENYKNCFENLTTKNINGSLFKIFNQQVYFKDPFNEVRGLSEVQSIYRHKLSSLKDVEYRVHQMAGHDKTGYIEWRLYYQQGSKPIQINGLTKILLNDENKIIVAIDYWDPVEFIYSKNPFLNKLLKLAGAHKRFQAD